MHVERIYCDSLAHSSWQTRVLFIGVWRPPHPKPKGGGSENSKFTTEEAKLASGASVITTAPA